MRTDLFAFKLNYNDIADVNKRLYNGNISQTLWKIANTDSSLKDYEYTYDALNRITSGIDNTSNYNLTSVAYDKNGNITNLERKGHINVGATSFGNMDLLNYEYETNSNKLKKVTDTSGKIQGFNDGANQTTEYTYDVNGNMITDANKGITSVLYNYLNLPTEIKFNNSNTQKINYTYTANSGKLKKIANDNGNITTTDYAGNYIYENGGLKQISQPEGYIEPSGNNFQYVYQYRDLKNTVRLSYSDADGNGSISQNEIRRERNYYPFGLEHEGYNNVLVGAENNLKTFQGQEFTKDLDLNVHQWKYRVSDPALGRFWQIDPLASDYVYNSTYAFSENRVIDGVELEGLEYVNANEAKIEARGSGVIKLKTQNLNFFARALFNTRNSNPANWKPGQIGVDTSIGSFSIKNRKPLRGVRTNQMKIQKPITKSTGQEDRRFKDRTIGGAIVSGRPRGAAKGLLALVVLDFGMKGAEFALHALDQSDIGKQQGLLRFAFEDLQNTINGGLIDDELLNSGDLTSILNVIFQGESNSDNKDIYKIGIKIFDRFNPDSKKAKDRAQRARLREFYTKTLEQLNEWQKNGGKGDN